MSFPSPLPAVEPPLATIDLEAFALLREDLDPEDLAQVVALYLDNLPSRVAGIREACDRRDGEALAGMAHSLKSASRQLGILRFGAWCEKAERAARAGALDLAAEWVLLLEREIATVRAALQQAMA
ncbi:MAG: Hpt domain-containing protein [Magnetococcales bacterium]|nr:Hpt domain-containing protein [Magnetococcales bacterium]